MPSSDDTGQKPIRESVLETFERQVLVFPLLVVLLACTSFLFDGRCAAWQWWTAGATVVLVPFSRRGHWRGALRAAGLFTFLMFAIRCLIPPLVWDSPAPSDMQSCHLPMIQLLIEGWNPVTDPMAERITASLGLDPWGMAPWHVVFSMKALAVFSAVAFAFVGDPYALSFPLLVFLWLGVLLSAARLFGGFTRLALFAALLFILPMVARQMPIDLSIAFTTCGLLLTMQDALRRKECDWTALAVWGAWMATLKLNGVLGLAVFAAAFAFVKIRKERGERKRLAVRFAAWIAVVSVVAGIVSWNPFGTSWRTFGHPLYPYRTVDVERFPPGDLAWDMQLGNDDVRLMGRGGRFAHAYLSPTATIAFYRWSRKRSDFDPKCGWWYLATFFPDTFLRLELWSVFFVLLLLPAGRPWAVGGILLMILVPLSMVGYTRYQPWFSSLGCVAVALGAERTEGLLNIRVVRSLSALFATGIVVSFAIFAWTRSGSVECKAREVALERNWIRPDHQIGQLLSKEHFVRIRHFVPLINHLTCFETRCKLLVRELNRENKTMVASANGWLSDPDRRKRWDERNWPKMFECTSNLSGLWRHSEDHESTENTQHAPNAREPVHWTPTPFGYWVPDDEDASHIEMCSNVRHANVSFVLHAWFKTYPKEIWRRLRGPWLGKERLANHGDRRVVLPFDV